jgi:hypothetical protein
MQTIGILRLARELPLIAIITLAVACADSTTRMTSLPNEGRPQRKGDVRGTVVLLRIAKEDDGKALKQATLSTLPRWKAHLLINVGPVGHPLDAGQAFGAGQLDSVSRDAGWAFVTLPPGTYQLAFAAYRTRFAIPGSRRAALGFGQSGASQLEVPGAATLLYVGTFSFTCHGVDLWWAYVERECTKLEVRDERDLARQVAATSLSRFGPMQTALALAVPVPSAR